MSTQLKRKYTQGGSNLLHEDVAQMIADRYGLEDKALAHDIIVVVRERTLSEIASWARENVR